MGSYSDIVQTSNLTPNHCFVVVKSIMKYKDGEEFVKNLVAQYCPDPTVSNSIRLDTYYKKAHSMFYQALDFVKAGNDARSYIELMRYAQFFSALSKHNGFSQKQYQKDRNLNKKRLNNAITKLEELKPKLIKSYNDEIEKEKQRLLNPQPPKINDDVIPSAPDLNENDDNNDNEEEKKQNAVDSNSKQPSPNRWNNLKIESSPHYNSKNAADAKVAKKSAPTNQMDAIFGKSPQSLTSIYICDNLVSGFMKYAQKNTQRDIETCGVLTGKYLHDSDAYLITYCIIPKQKGSANTVQTLHEEELIGVQEEYGVITLGWIHTHPSQTCFLSSVDMHCQLSYQIMMPNAIAIVYAPTDKTETFSLTKKGIDVLSKCSCQGFHRHEGVSGLYAKATHVRVSKHKKCKFIDLRSK